MKKALLWTSVLSLLVFFVLWGVIGLMIYDGDYNFTVHMYIALACAVLGIGCLIGWKLMGSRCPHCGRLHLSDGKYCSYCGKKIEQ